MAKRGRKKKSKIPKYLWKTFVFIVKLPYKYLKWAWKTGKKISEKGKVEEVKEKREKIKSKYKEFKVIKTKKGNYQDWLTKTSKSDSQIGIILGARGSGKTAFGIKFLENFHSKYKKKCFAIGFKESEMPSWITVAPDATKIKNNSIVLIDEGGILFNSRKSMTTANKMLSELIMISRHKNISIIFISQNSSNLEINILRQADFLILKPSSLLQKEFERKIIQKIYEESSEDFKTYKDLNGLTCIYADKFKGFITNPLPSFWKETISKNFK